ncbi:MAG: hypothetical protein H6977_04925 [Gammaproteobacteria bacterium]|nr:hypothetical protein [Gammaproteobacteria bacterium]MCP5199331.1 hypothetical protein [Gammaproteobacteria bacterium]
MHAFELDARPEPPLLTTPAPAAGLVDAHPAFAWGARDGIRRYHLQVARDAEFADVVVDQAQITTAGHTSAVPLATGEYFWRVAAVDATDEGPFSDVQQFRRLPEPPPLNDPALDDSTLTIRWRAGDAGDSFHFQLAADAEFAQPLVDADCTAAEISVARPAGGTYYMRVKTVGSDGFEGPYGGAQALEVPAGGKPWWLLLLLPLIGLAL